MVWLKNPSLSLDDRTLRAMGLGYRKNRLDVELKLSKQEKEAIEQKVKKRFDKKNAADGSHSGDEGQKNNHLNASLQNELTQALNAKIKGQIQKLEGLNQHYMRMIDQAL